MAWLLVLLLVVLVVLVVVAVLTAVRMRARVAADPTSGIDPLALGEPWRRFVGDAMQAKRRYAQVIGGARRGPLHDRLVEIGRRVEEGVIECWRAGRSGQALADARKQVDATRTRRRLETLELEAASNESAAKTADAMRAQLATAERLDATIAGTRDRLRLLVARMDEAVTRAAELSVSSDTAAIETLSDDVDGIVGELEAVRQGLEATEQQ